MTTTTEYATWANLADELSLREGIEAIEDADDFDLDAIEADYREAIDAILPDGVTLEGDQVYGPYPIAADWDLDAVREAIREIDFWAIVERHAKGD